MGEKSKKTSVDYAELAGLHVTIVHFDHSTPNKTEEEKAIYNYLRSRINELEAK